MAKAKDGSECFTRTNKSGGKYVTCKGAQKGGPKSANKKVSLAQQERSLAAAAKRKAKAKPKAKVPAIKVVKGTKKSIDLKPTSKAVGRPRKPKETEEQKKARMTQNYRKDFANLSEATLKEYLERSESRREFHDLVAIPVLKQLIEKKKGRVTGPKLPQRTSTTGGTGVITGPNGGVDRFAPSAGSVMMSQYASRPTIPVYATEQEQNMADISAYMNETGRIPMGPFDAGFIEFQASRGGLAKTKARSDKAKAVSNFKMSASERRDLIFRWELWWRYHGALGLKDYMNMPTRVANNAFTSKEDIENKGKRERIFQKLEGLIGDGNTSDGTTWKTITTKEIKSL